MPSSPRRAPMVRFGERVRARRIELGLSQESLAERAELHRTYVGSIERGQRNVALVNIVRLADALAVDPGDLVRGLGGVRRTGGATHRL